VAHTYQVPELIRIEQLAQRLGITVRHVRRLVAERRVPYLKVGRLVRFDTLEVTEWLDSRRRPPVGDDLES
jgi:excisionase family DNA binding protein